MDDSNQNQSCMKSGNQYLFRWQLKDQYWNRNCYGTFGNQLLCPLTHKKKHNAVIEYEQKSCSGIKKNIF